MRGISTVFMKSGSAANGRRSKQSQQHGAVGGDLYNIDDLTVREFFYTVKTSTPVRSFS